MKNMGFLLQRSSDAIDPIPDEEYREIGVRSHGRGVFHKDAVKGRSLGDKRVFKVVPNALVLNIVFAWEQAVAVTTERERGFIASHRFPMFLEREGRAYLPFILELLLTRRGRYLLELASPGGAGRNKTLGQQEFLKLEIRAPSRREQVKIAAFLGAVDERLDALRHRRNLLTEYKRGVMQQLFSQKLRFKRDDGTAFPKWEERSLGDVATFDKGKGVSKTDTATGGATPCIRYAELYTHYGETIDGPISSTSEPPDSLKLSLGGEVIVPASGETAEDIATFACVIRPGVAIGGDINIIRAPDIDGRFLARYLGNHRRTEIAKLAQGNSVVHLYGSQLGNVDIAVPHPDEQRKIVDFLTVLDAKIDAVDAQMTQTEAFKKGLLQQMFV